MSNVRKRLATILSQRRKLELAETKLKALEDKLLEDLKSGTDVAAGLLTARVKEWERRSPAWRGVVERELGAEYAARVLAGTRPDKFEKLVWTWRDSSWRSLHKNWPRS
jgi:hypothetical protein